jgi:hypothetical protein
MAAHASASSSASSDAPAEPGSPASPVRPTDVFARSPRIVSRRVAGDHLLVPLASRGVEIDSIFNLNETGAFLWDSLDGSTDVSALAARVSREFDVRSEDAERDAALFLARLLTVGAIARAA